MEVSVQSHAPADLAPRKALIGPQSRYGSFGGHKNFLLLRGFERPAVLPVALSVSRLRYPGFHRECILAFSLYFRPLNINTFFFFVQKFIPSLYQGDAAKR